MYGASSKLGGRGGGRGGGATKRLSSSFPPPPPHRPSSNTASRLPLGGGAGPSSSNPRNNRPVPAAEESFSLIPGDNPPAFAMIIRLAPDLVDEIKRVEAMGETPRIKFGSIPANPTGNVINVGGKEFRFTWSREPGDLCDIYEERQSGEDGNGLLVESGCAWRKVNVQRILDESTKNHVKMRSEEAERKLKSRKAIVLDPGNPSMKSQIKQLAAVESNPWRTHFKQKKESPFKKRKVEPPPVGGPPKSTFKSGFPSTVSAKGRHSSSPLPSAHDQSGASASPFRTGSIAKSQLSTEEITPVQTKRKDNVATTENEIPTVTTSAVQETPRRKWNFGVKSMDLENMICTLLTDNPKGMGLKDLKKAIGDTVPNSTKKIEPILNKIATCQAPGRYVLKQGAELENFKKPSSESGSSPEDNHQQTRVPEDKHDKISTPEPRFSEKNPPARGEKARSNYKHGEESNALEKYDISRQSPDLFGEKKISDNSEGQVGSSSDSGSDSDSESDSSDSGTDSGSHSRSRSRSPAGSGSGSSSDSESDASSNSKEGSDEDVDIMTSDDDKEPQQKLQSFEPEFSVLPDPWKSGPNETDEKQDGDGSDAVDNEDLECAVVDIEGHESDTIDIEKDLANDGMEVEMAANDSPVPTEEGEKLVDGAKPFSSNHVQEREAFIGHLFDDNETSTRENIRLEQSDSSEITSKGKSKRGYDMRHFDEKSERSKRPKAESLAQAPISGGRDALYSEGAHNRYAEDTYKSPANQVMNRADREGQTDFGSQKGHNPSFHGKPSSDFKQSGRRYSDQNTRTKAIDAAGRSKHADSSGHGHKFSEKSSHTLEDFPMQREKGSRDNQKEDTFGKEKRGPRNPNQDVAGGRYSAPFDSHYRKQSEIHGKLKDAAQVSNSQMEFSPKDSNKVDMEKHPVVGGRGLHRELSDLELGELREPFPEETLVNKQFEKGSFKQSENKPSTSDNCSSDLNKGKQVGKATLELGKPSPIVATGVRRTPEHHVEDLTRSRHKVAQSQPQHLSAVDHLEVGPKLTDKSSRTRQNGAVAKLGNGIEDHGESHKKVAVNAQPVHDSRRGLLTQTKDSKVQAFNTNTDLKDGRKDTTLTEGNNTTRKRRESSSEEDNSTFSKYEKDAPELKGPIKDLSQYKEYVDEYRDKYDVYCSLNKILENYRNDFLKLGEDLEYTKGRDSDRYHKILVQLKESYRQCGKRHKRLKKIFIVLHKELKNLKQRIKDYARKIED